jgi:hypothetical protein
MEWEMDKVKLPWDDTIDEWYSFAQNCLLIIGPYNLGIPQERYADLVDVTAENFSLNTVGALCNAVEMSNAKALDMSIDAFVHMINLNMEIAKRWRTAVEPIRETVERRLKISAAVNPKNIRIGKA